MKEKIGFALSKFISVWHICYLVQMEAEKDDCIGIGIAIGIGIELRCDYMIFGHEGLDD